MEEHEIFSAVGIDGFTRLVAAFYRRVPTDDILGPMYPKHDLEGAEKRMRDFLIYRFGGPQTYIEERGHPRLRMRHNPFAIDVTARNRWMKLMGESMEETQIPAEAATLIRAFFEHMATFMINRDQLPMAH